MQYLRSEKIYQINNTLSKNISDYFKVNLKVRYYENPHLAIYDLGLGLQQFLSHKPKIGVFRSGTSLFENLLPHYYRSQTPIIYKKPTEDIHQFVSQLDHEVNYVLWTSEHEITGEILIDNNAAQELHQLLSAKRIFSIQVKSQLDENDIHRLNQNPYSIILVRGTIFKSTESLIIHSDKLKAPLMVGQLQTKLDSDLSTIDINNFIKSKNNEAISTSVNDELFLKSNFNYFFKSALKQKMNDRYVFYSNQVSGALLKDTLDLSGEMAFAPTQMPLWIIESFQLWWPEAIDENFIRGLLVLNKAKIHDSNFWIQIFRTHEDLTRQSTWTI